MSSGKKVEEGQEHIRQAEKHLKTSLLKWRPDYELAADEYNQAATCFRVAKSYELCRDTLMKCANCHKQMRAWFHAAKCYDQAMLICKEMGALRDVKGLAERACSLYQQHGSPDAGASSLDKAAKMLEQTCPQEALVLYQHAVDVVMIEDSNRQAAEYCSKVARILVKLQMFDEAADALRREIGLHQQSESYQAIGRLAVALVLVQLARGDYVAAEKAFKEWGNCCDGPEAQTLERLLQAYDDEDPDAAASALRDPFIRHMDVEYAKLARDLPLPQGVQAPAAGGGDSTCSMIVENAAASYVPQKQREEAAAAGKVEDLTDKFKDATVKDKTPAEEDDEFEGGLC